MAQKDINEQIFERLSAVEAKLSSGSSEPDFQSIGVWLPEAFHEPGYIGGIVVDEGLARESECRRIPLGEEGHLTYSKGVVGALSPDQEKLYCESISDMPVSPELTNRQKVLRAVAIECQRAVQGLPLGERLETFMQCFVAGAKDRGVEI